MSRCVPFGFAGRAVSDEYALFSGSHIRCHSDGSFNFETINFILTTIHDYILSSLAQGNNHGLSRNGSFRRYPQRGSSILAAFVKKSSRYQIASCCFLVR